MLACRFLNAEEFRAAEDARMELARTRTDGLQGAALAEIVGVGVMWFAPWYHDPADAEHQARRAKALAEIAAGTFNRNPETNGTYYLSRHYFQQWSTKRPPIVVLCPNGSHWCVDSKSSNGDGWQVTGDPPKITCAPSIAVTGYHGYLRDGVFTDCLDSKTPFGIKQGTHPIKGR